MWKLTIEDDQASKTVVPLVRDDYAIGRAEENTVRLTERNISRRHARLTRQTERWLLLDLTSYNGCFVNGQRVSTEHEILHGDLVQLGDYRLQVMDDTVSEPAPFDRAVTMPAAPRSQALLGQPDRLVMVVGPSVGAEYPLVQDRPLVIGRGEECDVPVNHPSVSRVHAEIQPLGDGRYEIVDRNSANGVRVNGVELPRSLLDARDVIELGDVILKFIPAGDIYVPGTEETLAAGVPNANGAPFVAKWASTSKWSASTKLVAIGAVVAALLLLLVAIATRGSSAQPELAGSGMAPGAESAMATLSEAKALLDKGDSEGAVRKASAIPEGSNARLTTDFRQIQSAWADSLFAQAANATDTAQKRALLDRISRATAVDSVRRKRAASDLNALDAETVDISELPSSKASARPTQPANGLGDAPPTLSIKPEAPVKAASTPAPARKTSLRDPSETGESVQDLATSGDHTKMLEAKRVLQKMAAGGAISDRDLKLLRALCKQLGDASCSN
jgi:pSer/pThr/pTyr-binding forkhead associated (FHA) protein